MSLRLAVRLLRLSTTIRYLTAMTMWPQFWTTLLKTLFELQLHLWLRLHQRLQSHPRLQLHPHQRLHLQHLNLNQFRLQSLLQYQPRQRTSLLVLRFLQSSTAWQTCLKRYLDQRFLCR